MAAVKVLNKTFPKSTPMYPTSTKRPTCRTELSPTRGHGTGLILGGRPLEAEAAEGTARRGLLRTPPLGPNRRVPGSQHESQQPQEGPKGPGEHGAVSLEWPSPDLLGPVLGKPRVEVLERLHHGRGALHVRVVYHDVPWESKGAVRGAATHRPRRQRGPSRNVQSTMSGT